MHWKMCQEEAFNIKLAFTASLNISVYFFQYQHKRGVVMFSTVTKNFGKSL